jgi:DnaJ-class molecular chaperone
MINAYQVLAVDRTAKDQQIKIAFRALAMACHPDLHGGDKDAEQRFKEVSSAYALLRDPERRARYDCDAARAKAPRRRAHRQSAMATMAGTFVLTLGSGSLVGAWLVGLHGLLW